MRQTMDKIEVLETTDGSDPSSILRKCDLVTTLAAHGLLITLTLFLRAFIVPAFFVPLSHGVGGAPLFFRKLADSHLWGDRLFVAIVIWAEFMRKWGVGVRMNVPCSTN